MKAIWNNQVLADSDDIVVVENRQYFPADSVKMEFLKKNGNQYQCHWKGLADYYNVVVNGQVSQDAAWVYPEPTKPAERIRGRFAFWKDVQVIP